MIFSKIYKFIFHSYSTYSPQKSCFVRANSNLLLQCRKYLAKGEVYIKKLWQSLKFCQSVWCNCTF
ncbi:hypothetical protein HMPREF9075_01713 [Capnocytophaga sp. oral taxon 332 str. F0381]|nr:hypothetical protein HMPREF9075_01713 [Capnocytophaga sp. oral taxon 332 str. F0381]